MFNFPGLFHFSNFSSCKNIQFLCYRCNIFFISQKYFPFVCLEFFFWSLQYLFPPASFCSCLCLIDFHVSMLESLKCWWSFLSFIFTVGRRETNWKSWMPEWSSLTGRIPCGLRKASWLLLLKDPPCQYLEISICGAHTWPPMFWKPCWGRELGVSVLSIKKFY